MSCRRRPLHTCGVSFLAIAHSACSIAQKLDGRLGSTTRKMVRIAKLLNPLLFALQYQCLLVLSFIDDRLLAIENTVEKFFPPSKLVFDQIDDLLHLIETFPGKFDDAVDELPCFNQVLLLDRVVTHAISLLKFMINILMNWGREGTREKEILVDINCNEGRNGSESADKSECCSEGTVSIVSETQQAALDEKMKSDAMKGTYKEVLEMGAKGVEDDEDCKENDKATCKRAMEEGTREAVEDKEDCKDDEKGTTKNLEKGIKVVEDKESCKKDESNKSQTAKMEESGEKAEGNGGANDHSNKGIIGKKENSEGKDEKENGKTGTIGEEEAGLIDYKYEESDNGSIENEDDILELFETAWLMKPTRKGKGNLMPRSASYV